MHEKPSCHPSSCLCQHPAPSIKGHRRSGVAAQYPGPDVSVSAECPSALQGSAGKGDVALMCCLCTMPFSSMLAMGSKLSA